MKTEKSPSTSWLEVEAQTRALLWASLLPLALAVLGFVESAFAHGWLGAGLVRLALAELADALAAALLISGLALLVALVLRGAFSLFASESRAVEIVAAWAVGLALSVYRLGLRNWDWPLPAQRHHLMWPEELEGRHILLVVSALALLAGAVWVVSRLSAGRRRVALPRMALALWALTALAALALGAARPTAPADAPDILLVTVDTLRADRLGFAGDVPSVSPRLDALASQGLVFPKAYSAASWTLPGLASLLTGLRPSEHGATAFDTPLERQHNSIAEVLKDRGYRTAAVTSHLLSSRRYGLAQGFDTFADRYVHTHREISSEQLTSVALRELRRAPDRPLLLWVHYFDPHSAYVDHPDREIAEVGGFAASYLERDLRHREVSTAELAHVVDLYSEEIATTDEQIGRLFEGWRASRGDRPGLLALTSDHGELFGEHGLFGHGYAQEEVLRVPLLLWGPGLLDSKAVDTDQPRSVRSLPRTLLELAGVPPVALPETRTLLASRQEPLLLNATSPGRDKASYAVIDWPYKYVLDSVSGEENLFDVEHDPGEGLDLLATESSELESLVQSLRTFLARRLPQVATASARGLTAAERRSLESLGYVE